MGLLVDGVWHDQWYETEKHGGRFVRPETTFRGWVGSGPDVRFPPEKGRYHLYVSLACPWAHRALIMRRLKGLEDVISVSVVHPHMGSQGWHFDAGYPGATDDPVNHADFLHQVYTRARPDYTGRVTVPALWDREAGTIVNNESADLVRILNSGFGDLAGSDRDFYPPDLREEIDSVNADVYDRVNNGVYKAGFATAQAAYEEAVSALFGALDALERRLSEQRYLAGERMTEADIRLFTTLVRFDAVYVSHFKCNIRRLVDYPQLWAFTRDIYQTPGVRETVSLDHIKRHYFTSHPKINPTGIIPVGPEIDFEQPHGRG